MLNHAARFIEKHYRVRCIFAAGPMVFYAYLSKGTLSGDLANAELCIWRAFMYTAVFNHSHVEVHAVEPEKLDHIERGIRRIVDGN